MEVDQTTTDKIMHGTTSMGYRQKSGRAYGQFTNANSHEVRMNFGFFNFIFCGDSKFATHTVDTSLLVINPSTGLPLENGIGGIDTGGSPFGADLFSYQNDSFLEGWTSNPSD